MFKSPRLRKFQCATTAPRISTDTGTSPPDAPGLTAFGKVDAKDVFLALLRESQKQGRPVSANSHSGNYAPREFAGKPREQRHDFKKGDFAKAMERLFSERKIELAEYGRQSDQRHKIVIAGGT